MAKTPEGLPIRRTTWEALSARRAKLVEASRKAEDAAQRAWDRAQAAKWKLEAFKAKWGSG